MPDPYVTLESLKSQLDIDDTNDDVRLTASLDAASRAVDGWCGRRFWLDAGVSAKSFRSWGGRVDLAGAEFATTAGLIVKVDPGDSGTFDVTLTEGTDFILEPLNGSRGGLDWAYDAVVELSAGTFPRHPVRPGVQITAQWGWATVPDQVKQATRLLAVAYWKRKDAAFGIAGFDGFAMRLRQDPDVIALLAAYKRPTIA